MSYQILARKWRPQNFDEVVHQDHVSRILRNSILDSRVYHAYLFSGPRGVGKTTMARILAKALNCIEEPGKTPCNVCDNCIEITNGTSFDVIEIDGASNNGVDDIRELRENVNFAPVKSSYKIYIIDEVHMVTTQAFNALLKTLEEPPAHVKFIFATTEAHKIPDTILSRCQKFFFKIIPVEAIVNHLKHIAVKEGYNISDKAIYPIARAADGSMRDAQALLDQLISFAGSASTEGSGDVEISNEDALGILGVVPDESYIKLLGFIAEADSIAVIDEVDRIVGLGVDIPRFVDGFASVVRAIRLGKNKISIQSLLGLSDDELKQMKDVAFMFNDEELSTAFKIISKLQNDLKFTNNERINLEMALLDIISIKKMPSLASIIEKIESTGLKHLKLNSSGNTSGSPSKIEHENSTNRKHTLSKEKKKEPVSNIKGDMQSCWSDYLIELNNNNKYLHFILKTAKIDLKENILSIYFSDTEDQTYYDTLLESDNISIIESGISSRLGFNISVQTDYKKIDDQKKTVPPNKILKKTSDPVKTKNDEKKNERLETVINKNDGPAIEKIKKTFHGEVIKKGE